MTPAAGRAPSFSQTRAALVIAARGRAAATSTTPARVRVSVAVLAGIALGQALLPGALGPTRSGAVTHWGGWPLETALVASLLAASVSTFRVLDLLFRAPDARALAGLPLHPVAAAVDRLHAGLREGALAFAMAASLLLPALRVATRGIERGGVVAGLALVALAAVLVPTIAFAGQLLALTSTLQDRTGRASRGVTATPSHSVLQLAPGLAFAASAAALLLAKLGLEEPLRSLATEAHAEWTRAASLAVGLPVAATAAALVAALRACSKRWDEIGASVREADLLPLASPADVAAWPGPDSIARRLPPQAQPLYTALRVQLERASPTLTAATWIVAGLSALALAGGSARIAPDAVGALGAAWILVAVAPLRRASRLPGYSLFGAAALLDSDGAQVARRAAAARELIRHAAPLLLGSLAAGSQAGNAAVSILAAVTGSVVALSRTGSERAVVLTGAAATACAVGVAQAGPAVAAAAAAGLMLAGASALYQLVNAQEKR